MARLPKGEKQNRANRVSRLLQRCRLGLSEQEIAEETGLDRRTINNYLRQLDEGCAQFLMHKYQRCLALSLSKTSQICTEINSILACSCTASRVEMSPYLWEIIMHTPQLDGQEKAHRQGRKWFPG